MSDILYEDNHLLVAVKPPNMLSQADATGDTDILTELKAYIRETYHKPGNVYLGLVHRLDRPVGGLMVFARTSKAASRLSAQLKEHDIGREYLCVAAGDVKDQFTLTDYLFKNEDRNRVEVCEADRKGAKLAILHGRCVARRQGFSLCVIRLETGRSHQIRVQMSNIGAPLWGDNRYGGGIVGQQIALWGYKLSFYHPVSHELMTFYSMPSGSVWSAFSDLLCVPEDVEMPETPKPITLSDRVLETFEAYTPVMPDEPETSAEASEEVPGKEPETVPEDTVNRSAPTGDGTSAVENTKAGKNPAEERTEP